MVCVRYPFGHHEIPSVPIRTAPDKTTPERHTPEKPSLNLCPNWVHVAWHTSCCPRVAGISVPGHGNANAAERPYSARAALLLSDGRGQAHGHPSIRIASAMRGLGGDRTSHWRDALERVSNTTMARAASPARTIRAPFMPHRRSRERIRLGYPPRCQDMEHRLN